VFGLAGLVQTAPLSHVNSVKCEGLSFALSLTETSTMINHRSFHS